VPSAERDTAPASRVEHQRLAPPTPPTSNGGRAAAFWGLALINAFVGSMVGLERTVVPLLAERDFGLRAGATVGGFIIAFALAKALSNLFAGAAADRWGRRRVLLIGWLVTLPVAPLLAWAPTWGVVVGANALLGIGQAFTWSMTLNMMVDLMPVRRRGFAAGINEFAGYLGVSLTAFLTGAIASQLGLRPWPFALGIALALLGTALSLTTRETSPPGKPAPLRWTRGVGAPSLLGLATNLKDGLAWLALPLLLTGRGMSLTQIGLVAGLYPLLWAAGQPLFGPLSDRTGRRWLITLAMLLQGAGLALLALTSSYPLALLAAAGMGLGTGMAYPVLIAVVADRARASERATALGVYRFFRDGGYAVGALIASLGLLDLAHVTALTGAAFAPLAVLAWTTLPPLRTLHSDRRRGGPANTKVALPAGSDDQTDAAG